MLGVLPTIGHRAEHLLVPCMAMMSAASLQRSGPGEEITSSSCMRRVAVQMVSCIAQTWWLNIRQVCILSHGQVGLIWITQLLIASSKWCMRGLATLEKQKQ